MERKEVHWLNDQEFFVGDKLRFKCLLGDYYADKTDRDHLVILKPRAMLERLTQIYRSSNVKKAFELGIFQGGSVVYLAEALGLERMVAIDFCNPIVELDSFITDYGLGDRLQLFYGVSQNDRAQMGKIIDNCFAPGEVDLIIDDCSHLYHQTKNSFEVLFPYLKPGGLYVIEDWGWAHWRGIWQQSDARWHDRPAMSNLIFQIVIAAATTPEVFAEVTIWDSAVIIRKGEKPVQKTSITLDSLYQLRGKTLELI